MKIHIYHHVVEDESCIKKQLDRIESKLNELLEGGSEEIRKQIMEKLNAAIEDIKGTIK